MAKLRTGDKVNRVVKFLMGLRDWRVAAALIEYGFSQDDLDEGWRLFRMLVGEKLDVSPVAPVGNEMLSQLDAWENRWFPIARASLAHRFPEVAEEVFRNISQTVGAEVIVSVSAFLDRVEALATGTQEDRDALALLAKRGLNAETIAAARQLLEALGTVEQPDLTSPDEVREQREEIERALWAWYLEWSVIARTAIFERQLLRKLGFGSRRSGGSDESDDDADDADDADDQTSGESE